MPGAEAELKRNKLKLLICQNRTETGEQQQEWCLSVKLSLKEPCDQTEGPFFIKMKT